MVLRLNLEILSIMKTIIITGASRGIGLATAKRFLSGGWKVVGTYLNNKIPIDSPGLISIQMDQSSPESIAGFVKKIKEADLKIDALVNNAAIILDDQDENIEMEKLRKTFEVDLFGVINLTEQLWPLMNRGGHVVNMDSLYGAFSFSVDDESSSAYRMAKAGLNMYTRILAFRTSEQGIIISSLDPGWVKTDMGTKAAKETEGPDREPEEAAEDIFNLVATNSESGFFWRFGKKRPW